MADSERFSYEGLFSKNSVAVGGRGSAPRPKYDFAVAYPDPETLPLDGLASSLKEALDREGKDLAYYPDPAGLPSLRRLVAEKLTRDRNMKVDQDDVVLTSGSGEAIGMLIQALTDPGDVVLTEEFFYLGTMRQMRRFGTDVVGVKCDYEGIIPQELEATLERQAGLGKKVKYLYTIPTFQNPLGWTMTLERRKQVLDITRRHGIPVIYDAAHAFGVTVNSQPIGTFGDVTMFSFHATKPFHTIEGGCLVFADSGLKAKFEALKRAGCSIARSPADLGLSLKASLKR
ncbi:MAG: aminotransferase class I/II-fold pyridoxal phosphate-dependent enzyme [Chloroflexi bacterium]|nr:aminotransferase class I/II-fold pyridoxal phosphate-dependent enzyme [Chloroflexota bacterium]